MPTTTQPAHTFGTPPAGVGTWLVSYSGFSDGTDEFVQWVRVDDPLGAPGFALDFVNVGDIEDFSNTNLPGAAQSGTSSLIATNNRRCLSAVWRSSANGLYFTATIDPRAAVDPANAGQTTAHWFHLNTSSISSPSLTQQGNVGGEDIGAGTFTFFPSIAVNDAGTIAIGFSASSGSIFPGSYFATREATDPLGTIGSSVALRAGLDFYIRTFCPSSTPGDSRWGDYTGMSVDPADQCFWAYNQHAISRGTSTGASCQTSGSEDGRWGTAFGKFCSAVCGDGTLNSGEECDDGNSTAGDGCDENCVVESCGNGITQFDEECDDGNTADDDGCDILCRSECVPGAFGTDGVEPCSLCVEGTSQAQFGQIACLDCSPGSSAPVQGLTDCALCMAGESTAGSSGATTCSPCDVGTFAAVDGQASCVECSSGFFAPLTGQSSCEECAVGTFAAVAGSASCDQCLPGTFADSPGLAECSPCAIGQFADQSGQQSCTECTPGTFASTPGQSSCAVCGVGTFSAVPGSASCDQCLPGSFADTPGLAECSPCAIGQFADQSGQQSCAECMPGTFASTPGQSSCTVCDVGTFSSVPGSASCDQCLPGSFADTQGQASCTPCAPGSFAETAGGSVCQACPPGQVQPDPGQVSCVACGAGLTSNDDQTACVADCNQNAVPDSIEPDFDEDGLIDDCDPDDDNDTVNDELDCAPFDPSASAPPPQTSGLGVDALESTTLVWTSLGVGFNYDVISGGLADLAVDSGVDGAVCLVDGVADNVTTDPRADPAPGSAFYYLIRANNICASGSYGTSSSSAERSPAVGCP